MYSSNWHHLFSIIQAENSGSMQQIIDKWSQNENPDDIELSSVRILPLIVDILSENKIALPFKSRLRLIYKNYWIKSTLMQAELEKIAEILNQNNISYMLMAGVANYSYYTKAVYRVADEIELLVREDDQKIVSDIIVASGYLNYKKSAKTSTLNTGNSTLLFAKIGSGVVIRLHKQLASYVPAEIVKQLWDENIPHPLIPGARVNSTQNALYFAAITAIHVKGALQSMALLDAHTLLFSEQFSTKDTAVFKNYPQGLAVAELLNDLKGKRFPSILKMEQNDILVKKTTIFKRAYLLYINTYKRCKNKYTTLNAISLLSLAIYHCVKLVCIRLFLKKNNNKNFVTSLKQKAINTSSYKILN